MYKLLNSSFGQKQSSISFERNRVRRLKKTNSKKWTIFYLLKLEENLMSEFISKIFDNAKLPVNVTYGLGYKLNLERYYDNGAKKNCCYKSCNTFYKNFQVVCFIFHVENETTKFLSEQFYPERHSNNGPLEDLFFPTDVNAQNDWKFELVVKSGIVVAFFLFDSKTVITIHLFLIYVTKKVFRTVKVIFREKDDFYAGRHVH